MKKSVRITIITIAAVLAVTGLVLGLVFGLRSSPAEPEVPEKVSIASAEDFLGISDKSGSLYKDTLFELQTDLTLDFRGKSPIFDAAERPFSGIFDGKGHTVKLSYDKISESGSAGLFGYVSGARIKNLNVEITVTGTDAKLNSGANYLGGVAGFAYGENTVENVTARLIIDADMTVKTRIDINDQTKSYSDTAEYAGGIFGYACGKVTVKNCRVSELSVDASDYLNDATTDFANLARQSVFAGGAIGHAAGTVVLDGVTVTVGAVNVYADTVYFGGIAGVMEGATASNLSVSAASAVGILTGGKGYVGGIAGYALGSAVTGFGADGKYNVSATSVGALSFGGAAGFLDSSTFRNGGITVRAELVNATAFGGLVGSARNASVTNSTLSGGIYGSGGQKVEISGLQRLIDEGRAYYGTLAGRVYGGSKISGNSVAAGSETAPDVVGLAEPFVPVDEEGILGTPVQPVISDNTVPSVGNG